MMMRPALLTFALLPALAQEVDLVKATQQWHAGRIARLTSESGWLTLVGLDWLSEGENAFGSDPELAVPLEHSGLPAKAGVLVLKGTSVRLVPQPGIALTVNGQPATERALKSDEEGQPDLLKAGRLSFFVIRRGERFAIRVKDPESPARKAFKGIDCYPADPTFRVTGEFIPYPEPKKVPIPTVLGTVEEQISPGVVRFTLKGKTFTLQPVIEDPEHPELFFVFNDATSGKTTYPAGRFVYAPMPKDGKVTLDFNRAYNPPCAFSPYATCPLPPKSNRMDIAVEAGEKTYGHH
jgi:uncharacterized protein (DUF1684 family)